MVSFKIFGNDKEGKFSILQYTGGSNWFANSTWISDSGIQPIVVITLPRCCFIWLTIHFELEKVSYVLFSLYSAITFYLAFALRGHFLLLMINCTKFVSWVQRAEEVICSMLKVVIPTCLYCVVYVLLCSCSFDFTFFCICKLIPMPFGFFRRLLRYCDVLHLWVDEFWVCSWLLRWHVWANGNNYMLLFVNMEVLPPHMDGNIFE